MNRLFNRISIFLFLLKMDWYFFPPTQWAKPRSASPIVCTWVCCLLVDTPETPLVRGSVTQNTKRDACAKKILLFLPVIVKMNQLQIDNSMQLWYRDTPYSEDDNLVSGQEDSATFDLMACTLDYGLPNGNIDISFNQQHGTVYPKK